MIKRTLATFLILICLSGGAAWGSISRKTVEKAWARVAKADGFEKVPIHYEKSDVRNAWVEFDSEDDYTVHVTTALMGILTSEEEIAGILGHEIGHVRLGHYNRDVLIDIGRTLMGTHQDRMDDLARAVGISPHYLGLFESGERVPEGAILRSLGRVLGVSDWEQSS